jgi:hypothetical protein
MRRQNRGAAGVKQKIAILILIIGLVGFAKPDDAQKGGKGSGSPEPETTPMGVQHVAPNAGSKYADYLYGVVKVLDEDQMVLTKTKAGVDQTFRFNKKTKFIQDGKDSSFKSLKLGDEVWVDMNQDKKTGDMIARKVVAGVFLMQAE